MIGTWVSILPPIIAIIMVLVTRRVLLSLGSGIVAGRTISCILFTGRIVTKFMERNYRFVLG